MKKIQIIILGITVSIEILLFVFYYCFVGKIYINFFQYYGDIFPLAGIILIIGAILIIILKNKKI